MRKSLHHFVFTGGVMVIGIWELGAYHTLLCRWVFSRSIRVRARARIRALHAHTIYIHPSTPSQNSQPPDHIYIPTPPRKSKTVTHLTVAEFLLCLASWGQYVLGMMIYAKGWPRLSPRHFSSHEVSEPCMYVCIRTTPASLETPSPHTHNIR
jgi:hypothetical protein